jgi:hypothetical protein
MLPSSGAAALDDDAAPFLFFQVLDETSLEK